jgi:hypothetical protein
MTTTTDGSPDSTSPGIVYSATLLPVALTIDPGTGTTIVTLAGSAIMPDPAVPRRKMEAKMTVQIEAINTNAGPLRKALTLSTPLHVSVSSSPLAGAPELPQLSDAALTFAAYALRGALTKTGVRDAVNARSICVALGIDVEQVLDVLAENDRN